MVGTGLEPSDLVLVDQELFLPFDEFPWFRDAIVDAILSVERPHAQHLHWPALDDLSVDSIGIPSGIKG